MRRPSWSTIFVFATIAVMLVAINARPSFPDADSFYHAKMALMIRDHGFIHSFPWLQETTWSDQYVDVHLLYHVLLIPFVTLFDPIVGMKESAVVFGLLAFYAIYRFLKSIGSPYPEWLTFATAFSFDFLQRVSMPRAPSLSVVFLLFCIWAMLTSRRKTLVVAVAAFVWLYHGWPIVLVAYFCFVIADAAARRVARPGKDDPVARYDALRTGVALAVGIAAGLVVSPYFPTNVLSSVADSVKIGIDGSHEIPAGVEWKAGSWVLLVLVNMPVLICAFVGTALLLPAKASSLLDRSPARVRSALTLTLYATFFFVFALRSMRYAEYFVPLVILSAGAILSMVWPYLRQGIVPLKKDLRGHQAASRFRWQSHAVVAAVLLSVGAMLFIRGVNHSIEKGGVFTEARYRGSADWLRSNLPPGAIVFNTQWDSSMMYFYLDDAQYLLVGLDPRLMYENDSEKYRVWYALCNGDDKEVEKIRSVFHASAILIDRRNPSPIGGNAEESGQYEKAYEDEWSQIYTPISTL